MSRIPYEEEITVTVEASGEFKFTWHGYADNVTDALIRAQNTWEDDNDPAIDDELPRLNT